MTTTKDLVLAIQDGKSAEIQDSFDAIMNDKLVNAIESYREAVVSSVFEESSPEEQEQ